MHCSNQQNNRTSHYTKKTKEMNCDLHKILDGKDRRLFMIRCGDLLGKDDELGNDTAPAYNQNKDHK
jgi:hypothetical protein